jgi:hypothetical protein
LQNVDAGSEQACEKVTDMIAAYLKSPEVDASDLKDITTAFANVSQADYSMVVTKAIEKATEAEKVCRAVFFSFLHHSSPFLFCEFVVGFIVDVFFNAEIGGCAV